MPMRSSHEKGFIAMSAMELSSGDLLDRLGTRFIIVSPGLAYKLFPVCSGAQPATEALIDIIAEEKLDTKTIARVQCEVTGSIKTYLEHERPATVTEAQFSMNFAVACVLVHGTLGVAQMSMRFSKIPQIQSAMAKVDMTLNDTLSEASDLGPEYPEAAMVTVTLTDGSSFSKINKGATGSPVNPMPDEKSIRSSAIVPRQFSARRHRSVVAALQKPRSVGRLYHAFSRAAKRAARRLRIKA